jgi:anti-sigma regulatory factor (Ser/Thr protein kinase)
MDPLLNELWLRGLDPVPVIDEASLSLVRSDVRTSGKAIGLPDTSIEAMAIVATELGHNQLRHARGGRIGVRVIDRQGTAGLEVVAADRGQGIARPSQALFDRATPGASLGSGIAGVRRLAHEVDFDVRLGEGTCVWARAFAVAPDRRRELALFGRPATDESVSGDAAVFVRNGTGVLFGVADGLGHGPLAQDAAYRAVGGLPEQAAGRVRELLDACDVAAAGTRGAALTIGRLAERDARGELDLAGAGNIMVRVEGRGRSRSFTGGSYTVGAAASVRRRPAQDVVEVVAGELVIAFTDGLSSRATIADRLELVREPPLLVAAWLLETFARGHDDALVLVIR